MKRIISITSGTLSILYFVLPFGSLAAGLAGYVFSLRNYKVSAAVLAAVSVAAIVLVCMDKNGEVSLLSRVFSLFLLPISLMDWFCYAVLSMEKTVVLCMGFCSVCALTYMLRYVRHKAAKIITSVISMVVLLPLSLLSVFIFLFSGFGSSSVVETVYSPDKAYKAEVISSDQGALGGNTYVNLIDVRAEWNLYIFQISKGAEQVYSGEWDAWQNMEIFWKDAQTLVIDGKEYRV